MRNFPDDALNGEHLLRKAYEGQMERLGAAVEDDGLIVDLGCGSGTSTRYDCWLMDWLVAWLTVA